MQSRRSRPVLVVIMLCGAAVTLAAVHLRPEALVAWSAYISATEARMAKELVSGSGFLAIDFEPDEAAERSVVLSGAVVVRKMETLDAGGEKMDAPFARIHHWRGDVLIPGRSVAQVVETLQHGPLPGQEDVLQSRVLERGPDWMRVYLQLQRKALVTVTYNTEHVVRFVRYGARRATSTSTATKIAEVSAPNTTEQRELPIGDDRGFLWRLNAYWRYEDVTGGTIAECESVTLSRDVPALVRYVVDPLVDSTARESMVRTLLALRAHFASAGAIGR